MPPGAIPVNDKWMPEGAIPVDSSRSALPSTSAAERSNGMIYENTPGRKARQLGARAAHMLPDALGFAGSLVGAGGSVAAAPETGLASLLAAGMAGTRGAAIGGGLGKAGEYGIDRALGYETPDPLHMAGGVAGAAALQGAENFGGNVIAKPFEKPIMEVASPVAKGLYDFALKATKTTRKTFGDMVDVGIRRGTPVTKAGAETATNAGKLAQRDVGHAFDSVKADVLDAWEKATGHVQDVLKAADKSHVQIATDNVAQPMIDKIAKRAGRPLDDAEQAAIRKTVAREADKLANEASYGLNIVRKPAPKASGLLDAHGSPLPAPPPEPLTPSAADLGRQAGQGQSKALYRARAAGTATKASPEKVGDIAASLRTELRTTVPGYAEAMDKLAHAVQLRHALDDKAGSPLWDKIIASQDPHLEALTTRGRTLQNLKKAVVAGRKNQPLQPHDFPDLTGQSAVDNLTKSSRESVGMERALGDATARRAPLMVPLMAALPALAHNPASGLAAFIAARTALSPEATSKLALALANPSVEHAVTASLRQSPRSLGAILSQILYTPPDSLATGGR